jgi:hypothetical protein
MKATDGLVYRAAFGLAILCTGFLIFIMVAMPIYREQVFLERGTITIGGEMVILIGFVLMLIFDIVSLPWVLLRIRKAQADRTRDMGILALGAVCLILIAGDKVMADEISREYLLESEVIGEWIVLYVCLAIQLLYNVLILHRLYRTRISRA